MASSCAVRCTSAGSAAGDACAVGAQRGPRAGAGRRRPPTAGARGAARLHRRRQDLQPPLPPRAHRCYTSTPDLPIPFSSRRLRHATGHADLDPWHAHRSMEDCTSHLPLCCRLLLSNDLSTTGHHAVVTLHVAPWWHTPSAAAVRQMHCTKASHGVM